MTEILKEIKRDSKKIVADAADRDAKAIKLIEAFSNYNINSCKNTELHLNHCYAVWKENYLDRCLAGE